MAEWLKAVDLRSNVHCTSWVRFSLLAKPSVAQVDRASDCRSLGRRFKFLHYTCHKTLVQNSLTQTTNRNRCC